VALPRLARLAPVERLARAEPLEQVERLAPVERLARAEPLEQVERLARAEPLEQVERLARAEPLEQVERLAPVKRPAPLVLVLPQMPLQVLVLPQIPLQVLLLLLPLGSTQRLVLVPPTSLSVEFLQWLSILDWS